MSSLIRWLVAGMLVASLGVPAAMAEEAAKQETKPCHWWQFGHCDKGPKVEGLPEDAAREGTVVTVDLSTNTLYLFQDGELVEKSAAATGSDKVLRKGSKVWWFRTPRGRHTVLRKITDPVWRKPDWAFVEEGEEVPPPNSPKRYVKGHLGKYGLDLGDGILIHGTDDPDSIGRKASHGCIRLPDKMLEKVWNATKVGTEVWIFDSNPELAGKSGLNDLDFKAAASQ